MVVMVSRRMMVVRSVMADVGVCMPVGMIPGATLIECVLVRVRMCTLGRAAVAASFVEHEPCRRQSGTKHTLSPNLVAVDRQASQCRAQFRQRKARIEEGSENHVAGDAGETIEIQHACH
jgi:hypothetical protein